MRRGLALVLIVSAGCAGTQRAAPASPTGVFPNGDIHLSYQLTRPAGRGPFPAVVIGHGSGEVRKEDAGFLAANFVRRGYATLSYDKRGVGQSTGEYSGVGPMNSERMIGLLASDMAAGVRFLAAQPDIDRARIGLVGVSQAGWIIPLAASTAMPKPAFMIMLSGPTVSVGEEIYFSKFAEGTSTPVEEAYAELATYTGPRGFDPAPALRALDVPGLWLLGLDDRSIPIRDTIRILDELIRDGKPFRHADFPGADHSLMGADLWVEIDKFLAERR